MKSEFSKFCQNLESKLDDHSVQMITSDIADFFDQMQQKIYGIECLTLKKRKVREIQKLATGLADRLGKQRLDRRIVLKICKRLQLLKEKHPVQFNHLYPMPATLFDTAKRKRQKQVAKIVQCLKTTVLDPYLKKILVELLTFLDEPSRISAASWRKLDYHSLLLSKIPPILKNDSEESLDWLLIRFFHRYNFNTHAINDYCLYKIDICFSTKKPIDEISLKRWYDLLQIKPLENVAYNPGFRSLSLDLKNHLKIKLDALEDKGTSIKSTYYPQYTCSTAIRMHIEKLLAKGGYLVTPSCWTKHYQFLSEHTRGMKGDKLSPRSYQNGSSSTSIKTYEAVHRLLTELLTINKSDMAYEIKMLNRLPKKPK